MLSIALSLKTALWRRRAGASITPPGPDAPYTFDRSDLTWDSDALTFDLEGTGPGGGGSSSQILYNGTGLVFNGTAIQFN